MTALTKMKLRGGREAWLHLALRLFQVVLLVAIGWFLTRAIMLRVSPESAWSATPITSGQVLNRVGAIAPQSYDFSTDPFRLNQSDTVRTSIFTDIDLDVPETSLDLTLKGRTVGNPGSAILRLPNNEEQTYREGEEVLNNVTLESVTSDFIVLNVRGELERLTFLRDDSISLLSNTASQDSGQNLLRPAPVPPQNNVQKTAFNVETFLKAVRLNAKYDNGTLIGHVIQARGDEGLLKSFGLQSGDIMTALNGDSLLEGRLDIQALYGSLSTASNVNLDIIRDGRPRKIRIGS